MTRGEFKEYHDAYGVLSDSDKRARYNRFGKAGLGNMRRRIPRLHRRFWRLVRRDPWRLWLWDRGVPRAGPAARRDLQ